MDMKAINHTMFEKLTAFIGEHAEVSTDLGRKKMVVHRGVLREVYPQVFILDVPKEEGGSRHLSFNYVDIFTGTIRLVLFKDGKAYQFAKASK